MGRIEAPAFCESSRQQRLLAPVGDRARLRLYTPLSLKLSAARAGCPARKTFANF